MPRLEVLPDDQPSRRQFLQLLGGTALATACRPPREKILPYARQPPEATPGKAVHYATSLVEGGLGFGILVESHQGRPTKIEGNADHPASLGATAAWHQASILDLYSPERATFPTFDKQPSSWDRFVHAFGEPPSGGQGGEGLHFVLEPTSSPLRISLIERIRARWQGAKFHFHRPFSNPQGTEAISRIFGRPLHLHPQLDRVQVIACFDDDLFCDGPTSVRLSHDFANGRRIRVGGATPNRLYVVEGDLSLAGAIADHRLRARPSGIPLLLGAVVREVARLLPDRGAAVLPALPPAPPLEEGQLQWIRSLAEDLVRARGQAVVRVGARQPLESHLMCHVLNGWIEAPIIGFEPVIYEEGSASHGLEALAGALEAGAVQTLVWLEGDPLADAPGDLWPPGRLEQVPQSIAVGLRGNRTTASARWFLPSLHPLEQWGDARAFDGTLSFIQPLIRPLYGGHGPTEVLAVFAGERLPDAHGFLRSLHGAAMNDPALALGLVTGSATQPLPLAPSPAPLIEAFRGLRTPVAEGFELSLRPDLRLGSGGGDGNDWLVELPHPITTVCWENPAHVSPSTMSAQGWRSGDWVELQVEERRLSLPVHEVPGTADGVISLALGWGRTPRGKQGEPVGVDASRLLGRGSGWILPGASATRRTRKKPLGGVEVVHTVVPTVQHHMDMEDRPILLDQTLGTFLAQPDFAAAHRVPRPSLYPSAFAPKGIQWGMSIDLNVCTGCASCVIACQAENNIPTVGRTGVLKGRHMHWLRIDRYRLGADEDDVRLLPQPMLCQHCEKAPCEYVCPVNATVHSPDGLNEMVYNRCIGTRFCSNNCPYKVRRFNWLEYNGDLSETEQMQKNPNVTVRARGVMEKCTYCVQRIRLNEIDAKIENRPVLDGEVVTACQAACPTRAIVFGPVSDPESEVSKLHAQPHSYMVLQEDLGTLPRTRYLAHLANLNEKLP